MTEEISNFGASFKAFMDQMASDVTPPEKPFFARLLEEHFDRPPAQLPVVTQTLQSHEQPNFHLAMEELLTGEGIDSLITGIQGDAHFGPLSISGLISESSHFTYSEGPIEYRTITLTDFPPLACLDRGVVILSGRVSAAVLISGPQQYDPSLKVEVMAPSREEAQALLHSLRELMNRRNVYRGRVLSLDLDSSHNLVIKTHRLPKVSREQIILPSGLLGRIEQLTVRFAERRERMLNAGRHLKRGILLHGPPGTGKTYTAMYLAAAMPDRTVILLTGRDLGLLEQSCAMARALEPALVIMEDVDLIAEERSRKSNGCSTPLLFELLNQIDGLADDMDVIFLLTTNRPDILEPALAARPGRIDQALEVPLPDPECRKRLFDLYGQSLNLALEDPERFITRTKGASGAFIKELLRRAALFATDTYSDTLYITDQELDQALHELVVQGGTLTQSLLGFRASKS